MVVATNDMRNLHIMIIYDNSKVISWIAITFLNDPITTYIFTFKLNITFNDIMPFVNRAFWHLDTHCWFNTICLTLSNVSSNFRFSRPAYSLI